MTAIRVDDDRPIVRGDLHDLRDEIIARVFDRMGVYEDAQQQRLDRIDASLVLAHRRITDVQTGEAKIYKSDPAGKVPPDGKNRGLTVWDAVLVFSSVAAGFSAAIWLMKLVGHSPS